MLYEAAAGLSYCMEYEAAAGVEDGAGVVRHGVRGRRRRGEAWSMRSTPASYSIEYEPIVESSDLRAKLGISSEIKINN